MLGVVALVFGVRRVGLALGALMAVVGLFVAIVGLVFVFGALMPMSWERACDRGEGRACWGPMRRARTRVDRARWAAKGCLAGDDYACREWLEIEPEWVRRGLSDTQPILESRAVSADTWSR